MVIAGPLPRLGDAVGVVGVAAVGDGDAATFGEGRDPRR
jgi:hypothetical protein